MGALYFGSGAATMAAILLGLLKDPNWAWLLVMSFIGLCAAAAIEHNIR